MADIVDMGDDMGIDVGVDIEDENFDSNGNIVRCRCRDENLKLTLLKIRDSVDRAIYIMETCCCDDKSASSGQVNE